MGASNLIRHRPSEDTVRDEGSSEVRYEVRGVPTTVEGGADVIELPVRTRVPDLEGTSEEARLGEHVSSFSVLRQVAGMIGYGDTELTKEEFIEKLGLTAVRDWVSRYTAEEIGDEAHVYERFERDAETGEPELILEVRYDIESFERMLEVDDALLNAYIHSVPAEKRRHVVLAGIPCDAHCTA